MIEGKLLSHTRLTKLTIFFGRSKKLVNDTTFKEIITTRGCLSRAIFFIIILVACIGYR